MRVVGGNPAFYAMRVVGGNPAFYAMRVVSGKLAFICWPFESIFFGRDIIIFLILKISFKFYSPKQISQLFV